MVFGKIALLGAAPGGWSCRAFVGGRAGEVGNIREYSGIVGNKDRKIIWMVMIAAGRFGNKGTKIIRMVVIVLAIRACLFSVDVWANH